MFTKYGYTTLLIVALISLILFIISVFINIEIIKYITLFGGIILLGFSLFFFRDPNREIPKEDNVIVSPADGRVIIIKKIKENKFINSNANQVSIFMSPLNVHVNRIPINGVVKYLKYFKGDHLVAFHDKADTRNEHTEIGILNKYGKLLFTQVAGFVARRIIYEIKEGDNVNIGERFGMIKFGSRVDVIAPENWEIVAQQGDKVKAGKTIIYRYKQ